MVSSVPEAQFARPPASGHDGSSNPFSANLKFTKRLFDFGLVQIYRTATIEETHIANNTHECDDCGDTLCLMEIERITIYNHWHADEGRFPFEL